jgi:hypothetical protein
MNLLSDSFPVNLLNVLPWERSERNAGKYAKGSQPWFPSCGRADDELLNEDKQNEKMFCVE